MKTSRAKLIMSGNCIEIFLYLEPVEYDFIGEKDIGGVKFEKDEKYKQLNIESSLNRTKRNIRQLIHANGWQWRSQTGKVFVPIFITFTFAENVSDLTEAHALFKLFIHRFNYRIFGRHKTMLKYLCVPEFQKRGAVHYHAIFFNLPYLENIYDIINKLWGYGYQKTESVKEPAALVKYISKYITKDLLDVRLKGRKKILSSRGLLKPFTIRDEQTIATILENTPSTAIAYSNTYKEGKPNEMKFLRVDLGSKEGSKIKELDQMKELLLQYEQYNNRVAL